MIFFHYLFIPASSHTILSPFSCTKPITLLLEAAAAKDMSCLIAGYCRVFIDPDLNVFPWIDDKKHKVSAEEGTKTGFREQQAQVWALTVIG